MCDGMIIPCGPKNTVMQVSFSEYLHLLTSLMLDASVAFLVIRRLQSRGFLTASNRFVLLLFNVLFLFLCLTFSAMNLSLGAGLGLFAILTILRFRGQVMRTDELIGLLLLIGLGLIHAAFPRVLPLEAIILIDGTLVALTYMIAKSQAAKATLKVKICAKELAQCLTDDSLTAYLKAKTGIVPNDIEVGNINLLEGIACLNISYLTEGGAVTRKLPKKTSRLDVPQRRIVSEMIS